MEKQENYSKYKSRKWIGMWVVEAILTGFIIYGAIEHVDSATDLADLLGIWVNFTVINVISYGSANVAEKYVQNKAEENDGNS